MAWVEKRLRGDKVFMLIDDAGQPKSGADNRVEIVYRPGGKSYRAALQNLEDAPGAAPMSDAALLALAGASPSPSASPGSSPSSSDKPVAKASAKLAPRAMDGATKANAIQVWTDGACTGNPGPMGIGAVLIDPVGEIAGGRRELSSYLGQGTNNIAELTAVQRALELLPRTRPVVVYTDSSYSIGVLTQGWKAKANQTLIADLKRLIGEFSQVSFVKVAGHAGVPENERCDELARSAIVRRQP